MPASTSPITRGWLNLAMSEPTSRAARMTAAIASIKRPKVSSPLRFSGFLVEAPGSGSSSTNVPLTSSDPTVPLKPFSWKPRSTSSVPPLRAVDGALEAVVLQSQLAAGATAQVDELTRLLELEVVAEAG